MADRTLAPGDSHRPTIMGTHGVVCSGHYLASQAGFDVLASGGNAMDAALAASGVLTVVRPHMTGIGGDLFMLWYDGASRRVRAINAAGPAPAAASIAAYRERRMTTVPAKGVFAVETPGCVAGWQMSSDLFATRSLKELLQPAIGTARDGFPMYRTLHSIIGANLRTLNEPACATYAPGGQPIAVGHLLKNPGLAESLSAIGAGGADAFYRGDIAGRVASFFRQEGGLLAECDFEACQAEEVEPIHTTYRDHTVWNLPPVSQGHVLLEMLNIVEGYELETLGWNQPQTIHVMVEAKKIAFADRLRYSGDLRAGIHTPLERLLSKDYAEEARGWIDPNHAMGEAPRLRELAQAGGDTTLVTVMDRQGNAVALIQSLYNPFGSGIMAGDTGIMLNNRLSGFWLQEGHPNALEPGKRTMSTLNSFIVTRDGDLLMSGGTPGGDQQVQTNLQILANVIDYGMDPQQATEATMWHSTPGTVEREQDQGYQLHVEPRLPVWVREDLERRGHTIQVDEDWSIGSHKILVKHPETGVIMAGASPSRDAYAVGR
ncbi:MAG TPA: gamma-glutamyltransferase [Chloroflexota bacterium]|nr:gamma-glutamyltransferase [Chloroflexota bacterium]